MRGKLWFLGGLAAGFVLGARAGREKYEEIVQKARQVKDHPTVQEAAGVVQEQASRLMSEGKDKLSQTKFAETKVGERLLSGAESGTGSTATGTSGSAIGSSTDSTLASAGSTRSSGTTTGSSGTSSTRSNSGSSGSTSSGTSF